MTPGPVTDARDSPARGSDGPGWLLGAVWVLFLVYPLIASLTADVGWPWRIVGALLTLGFGCIYVQTMRWVDLHRSGTPTAGALLRMLVLVLLAIATVPVIGIGALGFGPFLVAYASLALPRTIATGVLVVTIAVALIVPMIFDELGDQWYMALIIALVGISTGVARIAGERAAYGEVVKEQLTIVAERERVARDVHDVLGHSLTVVSVKAELAERLIDVDPDRARQELRDISSLSREALAEVRATVGGLRVARLGDELLTARRALTSAGVAANVPDDPEAVDPRYRIIFAWVLREAITNVVRHAGARHCCVELGENRITVTDDGRGFHPQGEGNGLRGIRERVEAAAGRLELGAAPSGIGTLLRVEM